MSATALDLRLTARAADPPRSRVGAVRVVTVLCLALAMFPIAQLGRIPVMEAGAKDAPVLVNDLMLLAVWAAGALVVARRRELRLDRTAQLALAFVAVGGVSAVLAIPRFGLSVFEVLFSLAYLVRWVAYFGLYVAIINFVRREDLPRVYAVFEGALLFFAAFGVFQSAFLPDFAFLLHPDAVPYYDWDPQGHRLVSTFLDPNFAGILVAMLLLVLLARLSFGLPVARWKLLLLGAALVLTLSRGALVGFFAGGMALWAVRGLNRRLAGAALLAALLVLPVLPLLLRFAMSFNKLDLFEPSAMSRVFGWLLALEVIADHPIIGVGFNTYGFALESYGSEITGRAAFGVDGGLLFILALTGAVGLACYLGMLGSVFVRCRALWRSEAAPPADRALGVAAFVATVALLVQSLFLNSILYPFLMEVTWVLWGLARVAGSAQEAGPLARGQTAG